MASRVHGSALLLLAVVGCTGTVGAPDGEQPAPTPGNPVDPAKPSATPAAPPTAPPVTPPTTPIVPPSPAAPVRFTCDPAAAPAIGELRRLSKRELANTLADLATPLSDRAAFLKQLEPALNAVPEDSDRAALGAAVPGARFRSMDVAVTDGHVEGFLAVAQKFAELVVGTPARLAALAGACATDADAANDGRCLDDFLLRFGTKALRRPPRAAELQFWRGVVGNVGDVGKVALAGAPMRDLLTVVLSMPAFSFHLEDGGRVVEDGLYELSPHELAARLSYLYWQTAPDDALLAAATGGTLATEAGLRAQVERLLADPRADAAIEQLFTEWLELERLGQPWQLVGDKQYDAFRGKVKPTPELRAAMIREVVDLTRHFVRQPAGTLADLFTTPLSFARGELAAIYGVAPWDGTVAPPPLRDERAGLLTRAALVSSDIHTTRPILKGAFIRKNLVCDELPDPPPDVPTKVDLPAPYTRRQETAALTEQPGTTCAACHALINPLGFATENFDGLGRARDREAFIKPDGTVVAQLAIDTRVVPRLTSMDEPAVRDGVELGRRLVDSGKVQACFARHLVRFARGRAEELSADGCALEAVRHAATTGGSLRAALAAVALDRTFRLRRRGPL